MHETPCDGCELYKESVEAAGVMGIGMWVHFVVLARDSMTDIITQETIRRQTADWQSLPPGFFDQAIVCARKRLDGECE